jgi:hypothetical protein
MSIIVCKGRGRKAPRIVNIRSRYVAPKAQRKSSWRALCIWLWSRAVLVIMVKWKVCKPLPGIDQAVQSVVRCITDRALNY